MAAMKRDIYDEDHEDFRASVRQWLERSVIPNTDKYIAEKPSENELDRYGLKTPAFKATVTVKGKENNEETHVYLFGKAKTETEKDKIKDRFFELTAEATVELCLFARENAADVAGKEAIQLVRNNLQMLSQAESENIGKHLKTAAASAPKELQGPLALAIGQSLRSRYERAFQRKDKAAGKILEEAETTIKQVAKEHPNLSKQADDFLFELQHLTVGRPAMEIDGEDIDGKKFKLSDYRGKVVVLDFWGHW